MPLNKLLIKENFDDVDNSTLQIPMVMGLNLYNKSDRLSVSISSLKTIIKRGRNRWGDENMPKSQVIAKWLDGEPPHDKTRIITPNDVSGFTAVLTETQISNNINLIDPYIGLLMTNDSNTANSLMKRVFAEKTDPRHWIFYTIPKSTFELLSDDMKLELVVYMMNHHIDYNVMIATILTDVHKAYGYINQDGLDAIIEKIKDIKMYYKISQAINVMRGTGFIDDSIANNVVLERIDKVAVIYGIV